MSGRSSLLNLFLLRGNIVHYDPLAWIYLILLGQNILLVVRLGSSDAVITQSMWSQVMSWVVRSWLMVLLWGLAFLLRSFLNWWKFGNYLSVKIRRLWITKAISLGARVLLYNLFKALYGPFLIYNRGLLWLPIEAALASTLFKIKVRDQLRAFLVDFINKAWVNALWNFRRYRNGIMIHTWIQMLFILLLLLYHALYKTQAFLLNSAYLLCTVRISGAAL
jgi:hypothetical protein